MIVGLISGDATFEGLPGGFERPQSRRVRGIAPQTILIAFQLAAVNQRKIQAWRDTLPGPGDQLPKRREPRREGFWTPDGYLEPTTAA